MKNEKMPIYSLSCCNNYKMKENNKAFWCERDNENLIVAAGKITLELANSQD